MSKKPAGKAKLDARTIWPDDPHHEAAMKLIDGFIDLCKASDLPSGMYAGVAVQFAGIALHANCPDHLKKSVADALCHSLRCLISDGPRMAPKKGRS